MLTGATNTFVNVITGVTTDLGDVHVIGDTDGDGACVVLQVISLDSDVVEIRNADGSPRCSLPAGAGPSDNSYTGMAQPWTAWLGDQLAYYNLTNSTSWLRTATASDCRLVSAFPLEAAQLVWQVVPAPGVLLVVHSDSTGFFVDGFGFA
jgi:hypothetical protein